MTHIREEDCTHGTFQNLIFLTGSVFTGSGTYTGRQIWMLCRCLADYAVSVVHTKRRHVQHTDDVTHVNSCRMEFRTSSNSQSCLSALELLATSSSEIA